jgi:hypothetical protein
MNDTRANALQRVATAGAVVLAALYTVTGLGLVAVTENQPPGAVPPLLVAAGLFVVLAALLVSGEHRWVWVAGAGLQVLLIVMYLIVAADRSPAFEAWGVTVKLLQIGLLGAFVGLAVRGRRTPTSGRLP